ncbi:MAG: endonuclease III domain-containing protein [Deltaproteobacteria bacterium]|nr:endonuclease III domain-containing protein [Deltaproteobacteria bacterium]
MTEELQAAYDTLLAAFGSQHWWPAESADEMIIGALLTQNTNWKNVEKALAGLRRQGSLSLAAIAELETETLAELIRPSGYFRQKAQRLRLLARSVLDAGGLPKLAEKPTPELRRWLLKLKGIGPETADSILLYAFERPVFVIDAYTLRIGSRHDWFAPATDYAAAQTFFTRHLPGDSALYNEFHALLVRVGKEFCRPKKPDCARCPLYSLYREPGPGRSTSRKSDV